MKLAVVGNYTLLSLSKKLTQAFKSTQTLNVEYEQYIQALLNPQSELCLLKPDILVFHLATNSLLERYLYRLTIQEILKGLDTIIDEIKGVYTEVTHRLSNLSSNCYVIGLHDLFPEQLGGLYPLLNSSLEEIIDEVNLHIKRVCKEHKLTYISARSILAQVGYDHAFDLKRKALIGQPYHAKFIKTLVSSIHQIHQCKNQSRKKVLILDLDHTMWGGVLVEDGVEALQVGNSGVGSIYLEVQRYALRLRQLGVMLCVCSKNNEDEALEALQNIPEQLIRPKHLSAWSISWENKADGIRSLAHQLSIGLDSMVFLDDNPIERALIKEMLPQVDVIPFPKHIENLPSILKSYSGFNTYKVTEEDAQRADLYKARAQAESIRNEFTDINSFVESLQMKITLDRMTDITAPRVAQLVQKSNQFNMTTIRRTLEEIKALNEVSQWELYTISVEDRFAHHGLVGTLILCSDSVLNSVHIDTFILSCRVLERNIEYKVLDLLIERLKEASVSVLTAQWLFTKKNQRYQKIYQKYGFEIEHQEEDKIEFSLSI